MSVFTKRAHDTTKGRGSAEAARQQQELDSAGAGLARQYGKGGYAGSTTAERIAQGRDFSIADTDRRTAASGQRGELASKEDSRKSQISDAVSGALDAQTQAEIKAKQIQGNQDTEQAFGTKSMQRDTSNKLRDVAWNEHQSRTQREDAITELYRQGRAEDVLFDEGLNGKLKMQDVDIYYKQIDSDLQNAFKMWELGQKIEFDQLMADMQSRAINWGTALSGIVETFVALYTR